MNKRKTLEDYGFPENYDRTNKGDVLDFILNINKDKSGVIIKKFDLYFPELFEDLSTWTFPNDFNYLQKIYHYLNDDIELKLGLCKTCGKRCKFVSIGLGYRLHCSIKCVMNDKDIVNKIQETNLKKYGTTCSLNAPEQIKKKKKTWMKKYGTEYACQSSQIKDKMKQTCMDKYGVKYASQSEEVKEKVKQTCMDKYGVDSYTKTDEYKEKSKQTCMDKYGVEHTFQSKEVKDKIKQTCVDKYGVEHVLQSDDVKNRMKQTCMDKYGVENYSRLEECRGKVKQTNMDRYGVEHVLQNKEKFEKFKQTCQERYGKDYFTQTDTFKEKSKQSCMDKYGVSNVSQVDEVKDKKYRTQKKNNSFHVSDIECKFMRYLDSENINYIKQYKSELYPYHCDFYFPDYDLYVEIQGHWSHGQHPFDKNNEDDLKLLEIWKHRESPQYVNAIKTWTIRDVLKRKTASENNLNHLEIFSCDLNFCIEKLKERIF